MSKNAVNTQGTAMHTPGPLHSVKVGDFVWIKTSYPSWNGRVETHLSQITHKDANGRLFICDEKAAGFGKTIDLPLIKNWRYGFSPDTGTAHHYDSQWMSYASPEEVEAEGKRKADIENAAQVERDEAERLTRIKYAAPAMLEAMRLAGAFIEKHKAALIGNECSGSEYEAAIKPLFAAIAKAEGK